MTIQSALNAAAALVKTIDTTKKINGRVWTLPDQMEQIRWDQVPFVIVSKMNVEPGSWRASSYGVGIHRWDMLVAVYIEPGPIVVTEPKEATRRAMDNAGEWYQKLADLLYANMTLDGTVDIIGDGEGKLFDYVTDNIMWNGRQFYGHLFVIPVEQTVVQQVNS